MSLLIVVIHVIVCLALIMIVLLQTGKGSDMGAAFGGGGSNTLFGATGASTFLSKLTTAAAVVFMLTSLVLAYRATKQDRASVLMDPPAVTETAPAVPGQGSVDPDQAPANAPPAAETSTEGTPPGEPDK
jgi:preprotein translocase subunit SecG